MGGLLYGDWRTVNINIMSHLVHEILPSSLQWKWTFARSFIHFSGWEVVDLVTADLGVLSTLDGYRFVWINARSSVCVCVCVCECMCICMCACACVQHYRRHSIIIVIITMYSTDKASTYVSMNAVWVTSWVTKKLTPLFVPWFWSRLA